MALGPGKYDPALEAALKEAGASEGLLMVINGKQGSGFSARLAAVRILDVPDALRQMADEIERDGIDVG